MGRYIHTPLVLPVSRTIVHDPLRKGTLPYSHQRYLPSNFTVKLIKRQAEDLGIPEATKGVVAREMAGRMGVGEKRDPAGFCNIYISDFW